MAEILNFSTIEEKKRVLEVRATRISIKDEMTGKVDIFGKTAKKLKLK